MACGLGRRIDKLLVLSEKSKNYKNPMHEVEINQSGPNSCKLPQVQEIFLKKSLEKHGGSLNNCFIPSYIISLPSSWSIPGGSRGD